MSAQTRRLGRLTRPDCSIAYEVTGEGGPALVFAHGLGGNHMSWFQQVAQFAPRHMCVTFAHRGFFPSSAIQGGPDPKSYAGDLAALVAELGIGDHLVVAQSMGGWTAVEYALMRPKGLMGIVLAATTGSIDTKRLGADWQPKIADWAKASEATLATLAAAGIHPAAGARMAREQPAMKLLYDHINEQNAALDKEALRKRLMAGRTRGPEELAAAGVKLLLIANDEDAVMPPVAADAIAAAVPGARVAHIPDAAHSGYFERPAEFNRLVAEFVAGLA